MIQSYEQLSDAGILRSICNPDNLPILESLLERGIAQQDKLGNLKRGTYQEKLSESKLEEALAETRGEVDKFLGVGHLNIEPCKLYCKNENLPRYAHTLKESLSRSTEYFFTTNITLLSTQVLIDVFARTSNTGKMPLLMYGLTAAIASGMTLKHAVQLSREPEYIISEKRIQLPKLPRTDAIPILAHEYTHHLQGELMDTAMHTKDYNALHEGMARGVERHISQIYREKEDNEMFLHTITKSTVPELKNAYANLCNHLNITPNKNLAKGAKGLSEYSIGNTYFCIEETKNGKEVYKNLFRSLIREQATWTTKH